MAFMMIYSGRRGKRKKSMMLEMVIVGEVKDVEIPVEKIRYAKEIQVAGHAVNGTQNWKDIHLVYEHKLLKPMNQSKVKSESELNFYSHLVKKLHSDLYLWVPRFYGLFYHPENDIEYLVLENLAFGMDKPNIIDLKMGTETYSPTASDKKRAYEIQKYPGQKEQGFRIAGYLFHNDNNSRIRYNSKELRKVTPGEPVLELLASFFQDRLDVIKKAKESLTQLMEMMHNIHATFTASSILILYAKDHFRLKMIDFSHVSLSTEPDHGYVHGIRKLISYLNEITKRITSE